MVFWIFKEKEKWETIKVITIDDLYPKDNLWINGWQKYFPSLNYKALQSLSLQAQENHNAAELYFDTLLKEFSTKDWWYFPTSPEANAYNNMNEIAKIKHFINHINPIEWYLSNDKKIILNMLTTSMNKIETQHTIEIQNSIKNNIVEAVQ